MTYLICQIAQNRVCRVFKIVVMSEEFGGGGGGVNSHPPLGGTRNFTEGIFLLGEDNLRRSDFDNLSPFQS